MREEELGRVGTVEGALVGVDGGGEVAVGEGEGGEGGEFGEEAVEGEELLLRGVGKRRKRRSAYWR